MRTQIRMIAAAAFPDRRIRAGSVGLRRQLCWARPKPAPSIRCIRTFPPASGEKVGWALSILRPDVAGGLDTDRIALIQPDGTHGFLCQGDLSRPPAAHCAAGAAGRLSRPRAASTRWRPNRRRCMPTTIWSPRSRISPPITPGRRHPQVTVSHHRQADHRPWPRHCLELSDSQTAPPRPTARARRPRRCSRRWARR